MLLLLLHSECTIPASSQGASPAWLPRSSSTSPAHPRSLAITLWHDASQRLIASLLLSQSFKVADYEGAYEKCTVWCPVSRASCLKGVCSSSAQPCPGLTSVLPSILAQCTLCQGSVHTWATGNDAQHSAGRNQSWSYLLEWLPQHVQIDMQ